jgi:hypothetical protein
MKVREIGMFSQGPTAAAKTQVARPNAIGITPTSPISGVPQDPADAAGTGQTAIAWGTAPTAPTATTGILRQFDFNNVTGSGVIFTWPSDGELVVPIVAGASTTLVLWNGGGSTGPACDAYFVWSE